MSPPTVDHDLSHLCDATREPKATAPHRPINPHCSGPAFSHKLPDRIAHQQCSVFTSCSLPMSSACGGDSQGMWESCPSRGSAETPQVQKPRSVMLLLPSLPNSEQRNILGAFPSIVGLTPSNYLPEVAGFAFGPNVRPVRQPVYSVPLQTTPPGPPLRSVY